ncbi:uncharacterized protein LOC103316600 isoform X2 [Nasonia vitripennis]|uniref:Uncharacterized protein n=1 Tax=Nasonia vitripennis TaxID=7425 RepID=A0A7M7HBU6_NASVI|nr:uncharacterized protein LOC103316600 isoform X2 [Nasonia vitripennis]XP_031788100.1 uncharacterized protein LOC103316600 isoform X2 [Nasonia vitripennis]
MTCFREKEVRMESREASTTYTPEALEAVRREEERRLVREGTEIWRARKEESLRQKQREQCELRRMLANYWPWGRPGGGAPCASTLRKRNVPLEPSSEQPTSALSRSSELLPQGWRTRSMMDRLRNDRPYHDSDRNIYDSYGHYADGGHATERRTTRLQRHHEELLHKQEAEEDGGVELAPLLRSGRRLHDCSHDSRQTQSGRHVATDATRPGYMIDSWRALNSGNRDYINELAEQVRRKQERAMEERRREGENCRRHFDTWRRLWGRPGHGAPIDHARRRNNLNDILYRTVPAAPASITAAAASVY